MIYVRFDKFPQSIASVPRIPLYLLYSIHTSTCSDGTGRTFPWIILSTCQPQIQHTTTVTTLRLRKGSNDQTC